MHWGRNRILQAREESYRWIKRLVRVPRYQEVDSDSVFSGLGKTIHQHAKSNDCAVVPCFLGHGIGDFFHGPPDIYHSLNNYPGIIDKLTNVSLMQ